MRSRCLAMLLALGVIAGGVKFVEAHPHAWIEVSVEIVFDEQKRMTAMRETWVFDYGYTVYALATAGAKDFENVPQTFLDKLTAENLMQLQQYNYFTVIRKDQSVVDATLIPETATSLRDDRVQMSFTLALDEPIDVAKHHVTYAIFDPSYYIEMLHEEREDAIVLLGAAPACHYSLNAPNPSAEAVGLAAALDQAATAEEGFGALFAERVQIICG